MPNMPCIYTKGVPDFVFMLKLRILLYIQEFHGLQDEVPERPIKPAS